ncbi:hypothetical protein G7043_04390 [Lentzea sp. NEAU-D13]|uniref:Uncharacterized protein n=1 Tax=Lentzea alba TaxID=2714351 RepID=A0A7C9RLT3_9PSEU|nr:hypothetical protein [Lentzea alba]NGY58171.1 hypothetical protein [Lentzea alba]
MGDERYGEDIALVVDLDVPEAARLISERLAIELGPNDPYGHRGFSGFDASGAYVRVCKTGGVYGASGEFRPYYPEPSTVAVRATTIAGEIVAALSGPPFRLLVVAPGPTLEELEKEATWRRLLGELRDEGWEVVLDGTAAPVALDGRLPSGESFYLRCRWSVCSLEVDDVEVEEVELEGEFSASYLLPDDAVAVLRELHQRWLRR